MTGSPTNQSFSCTMQTDFPASVLSANDVVGTLNDIPSSSLNDVIGAAFSVEFFLNNGADITASSVTGAKFINYGGNAALQFTLNTTSDPITSAQVEAAILVGAGVLAAAIVAGGLLTGVAPGLILLGLFLTGILSFIAVSAVAIGGGITSIVKSPLVWVIAGAGAIGLGVVAYSLLTDKKTRSGAVRTVRHYSGG